MMSSSRIFQFALTGGGCRHIVGLPALRVNERLVADWPARISNHCSRRSFHGQEGMANSSFKPQENDGAPKHRENLLNRIKSTQRHFEIVSLPNIITTSRALMAPAMGYFILNSMPTYALACCTYVVASDIADKLVAHLTNQSSPLNELLDALADKLVIMTSCIALYNMDIMSIYMLKSIVIRDFIIIVFGSMIRYQGFEDRPTLKQYFDINNYPTLCFRVKPLNRFVTGTQYSVVMAMLAFNHLVGDPTYDWSIYLWQGFTMVMSSLSMGSYMVTFLEPKFLSRPPKKSSFK